VTDKDDGRFKEDASSGDRPSRRSFLVAGAALGAATGIDAGSAALAQDRSRTGTQMPSSGEDLVLYNGKVHTMDDRDSVVSAVRIRGNRFAEVGSLDALGPNAINLNGRTVIPGLIESCDHIVSFGNYRPGYHTVLENAMSIAEIQAILAARRAEVPPGEWITALGAWNAFTMFAERRLPTRAELDVAVPDRPVLLYQTTIGPAVTNTPGIAWFAKASMPVTIGENGNIASGSQSTTALYLLRLTQTRDQRRRTHLETWAYSAGVGLTAHIHLGPDGWQLAVVAIVQRVAGITRHADARSLHGIRCELGGVVGRPSLPSRCRVERVLGRQHVQEHRRVAHGTRQRSCGVLAV
jgi:hypothetical protein